MGHFDDNGHGHKHGKLGDWGHADAPAWARDIWRVLGIILGTMEILMIDTTKLVANEKRLIDMAETLLAANKQAQADLAQAKTDLAAAIAANDPAAQKAVQDTIDQIASELGAEADKLGPVPAPTPDTGGTAPQPQPDTGPATG